jgi:SPW repeat
MAANFPIRAASDTAAMWNNVILGIVVAAFALTNTYSKVSTSIAS